MNRQLSKEEVQMDNKYMKKCSTSLATKEMQTKMSLRFYLIPVRMAIISNTKTNADEDVCGRGKDLLCAVGRKCKLV
jgi:hypothetical protein